MKILHLSDLHIGKTVNGFSMLEDQEYILNKIIEIIENEAPDAVIMAGDIYDKPTPSAEAVTLFDGFLTRVGALAKAVFVISGNHDSSARLAYGGRLMKRSGVHVSPVFDGKIEPVVLSDSFGEVGFYAVPFVKPAHVRAALEGCETQTYEEAFAAVVDGMDVPPSRRNVIIAHQFIVGAERGGSEEVSVGGIDEISADVFAKFDYAALGHIHRPQRVGRETVRYGGSPLKYSFSEVSQNKSVTVVEMKEKENTEIRLIPLAPLRDMREIKGSYDEVTYRKNYENTNTEDYIRVILTDEDEIPDAIGKLRCVYPNIMEVLYDNVRSRAENNLSSARAELSPSELFCGFYEEQNGAPMSGEQRQFMEKILEEEAEQ